MIPKKSNVANLENKKMTLIGIGLLATFALILASFSWTSYVVQDKDKEVFRSKSMEDEEIIAVNLATPPPPPPPPPQQQTTILEIVDDEEEIEDEIEVDDEEIDADDEIEFVEAEEEEDVDEDVVDAIVEDMPAFPGCEKEKRADVAMCTNDKIIMYLKNNVKYPQICVDANITGKVWVYYEIGKDGKVRKANVIKKVHPKLDAEALRVIKNLPKHRAGSQQGKKVPVSYRIPVNFILN